MSGYESPDPKLIGELRDRTSLPLLECRRLLMEAKDIEAAVRLAHERHRPRYLLVNVRNEDDSSK